MKALKIYITLKRDLDSPREIARIYSVAAHPYTVKWREYGHGKRQNFREKPRELPEEIIRVPNTLSLIRPQSF